MSKMSFYLEKYKQAREELMTKIGRYVLSQTEVDSLKEFKEKFVVIAIDELEKLKRSENVNGSNESQSFNSDDGFERQ